jgi:PP-loop superfamily ATP-utilizing enzyme
MIDKKTRKTNRMKEGRKENTFNPCYFCLGGNSRNDRKKRVREEKRRKILSSLAEGHVCVTFQALGWKICVTFCHDA